MKITVNENLSYAKSVDYKQPMPYEDRLKLTKAVDLRNNAKVVDMGNGYAKLVPIDKSKTF